MGIMTTEELFDIICDYCMDVGESHYELLDTRDRRFAIPYEQHLRKYYPEIFTQFDDNPEEYNLIDWDKLSPFELEYLFTNWAEENMDKCPYPNYKDWEWEEMEFSKAMIEVGLDEDVKNILNNNLF